jgi:hypothetical protein
VKEKFSSPLHRGFRSGTQWYTIDSVMEISILEVVHRPQCTTSKNGKMITKSKVYHCVPLQRGILGGREKFLENRVRNLRREKQRRYRQRLKLGRASVKFEADPADVVELLQEAGVFVPDPAPRTLGNCMTVFLELWQEGRVRVTRHRDGLG